MATNYDEARGARIPQKKVEEAMSEVWRYRRDYIRAMQIGRDADEELLRGFHAAVIVYYLELSNYRDEKQVKSEWESIKMWTTGDSAVTGADSLENWIGRKTTIDESGAGRGRAVNTRQVTAHLSGPQLVEASRALDTLAKQLGLGMDIGVTDITDTDPV